MSLRKKLLTFLWAKPSIKWLTEVENLDSNYNASTNQTYIDTGVRHSWDVPTEITATIAKTTGNRSLIIGCYSGARTFSIETTATNRLRLYVSTSTSTDPTYTLVDQLTPSSSAIPLDTPTKIWVRFNPLGDAAHTVNYEMGLETLNGEVKTSVSGSFYRDGQPASSRTLRMFYDYRADATAFNGGMKIYQLELKNGEEYRKYIPCLDLNNIPCMYEKGTGTLAYNDGTGNFVAGRTITEVDWMHLTGTQYFKTGLKPNTLTTTLKTKFTFEGTAMMMGCRNTSTAYNDMCSIYIPVASTSRPFSRIRLDWMSGSGATFSSDLESEVVELEITGNYAKVNGVEYTADTKTSLDMDSSFYIGACYTSNNSSYSYPQTGKVYLTHLYDPNKGERYCVPAHDKNNVGFFFDRINHFIMDNVGTNTDNLTWGDDIHYVDYLESTGPQWIDTGIPMQANYGVEINAKQTATTIGIGRYLFGDAPASTGRYLICVTSGGNTYRLGLDTLNKDTNVSAYDGKYHVHKVENKTYFIDGESKGSLNAPDFTRTRNARLFSVATTSTLLDNYWQIKQGKILDENGDVLTNFVPCIKGSNKPAMFDLVSRTFATNQATGDDFVYGDSILGIPEETGLPMGFVPLQYLRGEAGPYIDIGIKLGSDYGVEIVARNTNTTTGKTRYLFGSATTANRYMLAVGSTTDNYLFDIESSSYRVDSSFNAYDGQFHTHKIENKTYYIDGVSQGTSTSTGTFTTSVNAFLFGAAGASRTNCYWDIKSEKIFDGNGVLIQHLVPVLRTVDGVAGMLDLVSGEFLTNAGTLEFGYAF